MPEQMPIQADVYFDEYVPIDVEALIRYVDASEAGAAHCNIVERDRAGFPADFPGVELRQVLIATMGGMTAGVTVSAGKSPASDIIEGHGFKEEVVRPMLDHKAFAAVTSVDTGGEEPPIERMVFLYKLCLGLLHQGGTGVGFPHWGGVFPGEALIELVNNPPEPAPPLDPLSESGSELLGVIGEQMPPEAMAKLKAAIAAGGGEAEPAAPTLWAALREGDPFEMLVGFTRFAPPNWKGLPPGASVFATMGFSQFGLPELAHVLPQGGRTVTARGIMMSSFLYMLAEGPVLKAGHTMGMDENVEEAMARFEKPPRGATTPTGFGELLVVTFGGRKKRRFPWFF